MLLEEVLICKNLYSCYLDTCHHARTTFPENQNENKFSNVESLIELQIRLSSVFVFSFLG